MHIHYLYLQWKGDDDHARHRRVPLRRADPEAIAALTGTDFLQAIIRGELPAPPMAKTLDFFLVEVGDGRAAFEGEPGEAFLNPMGSVHGGWALTLVDSATGCAGMSLLPPGVAYTTIETKVNFSRPISKDAGRVRTEAWVVSRAGAFFPRKRA